MSLRGDERGYIGFVVLMVVTILAVVGAGAIALAAQQRTAVVREYRRAQACYIAEAGVEKVLSDPGWLNRLAEDPDGNLDEDYTSALAQDYYSDVVYAGGRLSVRVVRKPGVGGKNTFRIYSTGSLGDVTCVLKVEARVPYCVSRGGILAGRNVTVDGGGGDWSGAAAVSGNVSAGGRVTVRDGRIKLYDDEHNEWVLSTSKVLGDVSVTGDVSVNDIGRIDGTVRSGGNVTVNRMSIVGYWYPVYPMVDHTHDVYVSSGHTIDVPDNIWTDFWLRLLLLWLDPTYSRVGTKYYVPGMTVEPPAVAPVDREWAERVSDRAHRYAGSRTFTTADLQNMTGVWFVDGDVSIQGYYTGRAAIVATGKITVTGNLLPDPEWPDPPNGTTPANVLSLMSLGDIEVRGDVRALLLANRDVLVGNGSEVWGAVLAGRDLTVTGDSYVWYRPDAFGGQAVGTGGPVEIVTWQEKYPVY